ncbi:Glycoside Hydrolase Family 5 protein [Trametes cinnabarina]|uniref:Glycoside Hydrolase Family 5 protein n=1 Tax=Pycnoporus cinnabarinus TaxID=5643 RepID=A0A060SEG9_PYCCI|nr:Glycoside Hydrolase Family 5 protein [Trametes cinnabarina]
MVLTAGGFTVLLHSLGLSQGLFKPAPRTYPTTAQGLSKAAITSDESASHAGGGINYQLQSEDPGTIDKGEPVDDAATSTGCMIDPYDAYDADEQGFSTFDQDKANVYRYRQQQSVNLGSWFVHEQWMTPSLFKCATGDQLSELDIASGWGSLDAARSVLERHWDTFINASDFDYLAGIGINTVRLPIGYWSLGPTYCEGTPFEPVAEVYQNAWSRVVRAINMAGDAGVGVLVDLHGAPGSQNGQPHSGISDGEVNLFDNDWYINKTMSVLTFLTRELINATNVVGIQILNEPSNVDSLPAFYSQAISTMRQADPLAKAFPLYIHDAFDLAHYSDFVANRSDFVVLDHHSYFVFTPGDVVEPAAQHTKDVQGPISDALAAAAARQRGNLVIGEFSCALTDESLSGEADPDAARRNFCQGQMETYRNLTAGWAFWAYDKEDCSDDHGWCFKAAIGQSLLSTFFPYGFGPIGDPSRIPALADMASNMTDSSHQDVTAVMAPFSPNDSLPSYPPTPALGLFSDKRNFMSPVSNLYRREDSAPLPDDPSERAIAKGYSDGFLTAKVFALFDMSKLGFAGQYIADSLAKLGPDVIQPGKEHFYEQWFMEGLVDGETVVTSAVAVLPRK